MSALDLSTLQACFKPLQLLVLRHVDGVETAVDIGNLPAWCSQLGQPQKSRFPLPECFPYLAVFIDEARAFWAGNGDGMLRSGIWCEQGPEGGGAVHLEAAAVCILGAPILLVGPYYFDLDNLQQILQRSRQVHLDHEALEKAQTALAAAEQRQRGILAALPDRYFLFDRGGCVHHHNDPEVPQPGAKMALGLAQFLGEEAAETVLEKARVLNMGDAALSLEFERSGGDAQRLFEARLIPMGPQQVMCLLRDISEARELERRKAEFLSVAGHELRTPLTAIKGGLSMLLNGMEDELPELALNMLRIASRNSERLVNLINDLLDIQKIELSTRSFQRTRLRARLVVQRAVEDNIPFAVELGRTLVLAEQGEDACILAEFGAMIQVLTNLISNAVKFSPEGEEVRVGYHLREDHVVFFVADRGPGIPESHRGRIFEKFARIPGGDTGPIKGTGLGLSICKAIVDEHQGTLSFETEMGKGTTFLMRLQILKEG